MNLRDYQEVESILTSENSYTHVMLASFGLNDNETSNMGRAWLSEISYSKTTSNTDVMDSYLVEVNESIVADCFGVEVLNYESVDFISDNTYYIISGDSGEYSWLVDIFNQRPFLSDINVASDFQSLLKKSDLFVLNFGENSGGDIYVFYSIERRRFVEKPWFSINLDGEADLDKSYKIMLPDAQDWLFISTSNSLFMSKKGASMLMRKTKLGKELETDAKSALNQIESLRLINNFSNFESACTGNFNVMKRLQRILKKNAFESIDLKTVASLNTNYHLGLKFDSQTSLVEYEYKNIWNLLRVFNDDCLKSDLTSTKYIAQGKITPG